MFVADLGLAEPLVSFLAVAFSLALPLGILFLTIQDLYQAQKD
jgi:hypothetical protein